MTAANRVTDLYQERASTPSGRAALAAAAAAGAVRRLLDRVESRSGITRAQVAQDLEVTPGRVTQVMSGDGNHRIATLARYLSAHGYDLELRAKNRETDEVVDTKPYRRRNGTPGSSSEKWGEILFHPTIERKGLGRIPSFLDVSAAWPSVAAFASTYEQATEQAVRAESSAVHG